MDGLPLEELRYLFFADRWGWTPDQVKKLPARFYALAQPLVGVRDHVRAELAEAEAKKTAERKGGPG